MKTNLLVALAIAASACGQKNDPPIAASSSALSVGTPANYIAVDIASNQTGRLTSAGNGLYRKWNQYDVMGRPSAVQHIIGDESYLYTSTFGYPRSDVAAAGPGTVLTAQTFPDGETASYGYDKSGAMKTISTYAAGKTSVVVSNIKRNVRGQTVEVDYGNGAEQFHTYDDTTDLRLAQIYTTLNGTPQQYTYGFDANGNVTSVSDINGDATATYQYDSVDWLTGGTFSFTYDNIGNLTKKDNNSQSYFPSGASSVHPHALSSAAGLTYTYDANGNLSSRSDGLQVTWNPDNMPIKVTGGAATTTTNKYFFGELLVKKVQGSTTTYYLPSLRVENGLARKYFAMFAERDPSDNTLKFYHNDHLGSATLVSDSTGKIVRRAAYKPYGEDRVVPVATFTPKYQFTFKERELDGTSFYDCGARLFNPATGRWLSADTSDIDGLNRYAYTANNPLRYTDPTGHYKQEIVVIDPKKQTNKIPKPEPAPELPPPPMIQTSAADANQKLSAITSSFNTQQPPHIGWRFQQDPKYAPALKAAYNRSGKLNDKYGEQFIAVMFIQHPGTQGEEYVFVPLPNSHDYNADKVQIPGSVRMHLIAVIHTHPNGGTPYANDDADVAMANTLRVPSYVVGSKGMYLYDWRSPKDREGQETPVRPGMSWLETCGGDTHCGPPPPHYTGQLQTR